MNRDTVLLGTEKEADREAHARLEGELPWKLHEEGLTSLQAT